MAVAGPQTPATACLPAARRVKWPTPRAAASRYSQTRHAQDQHLEEEALRSGRSAASSAGNRRWRRRCQRQRESTAARLHRRQDDHSQHRQPDRRHLQAGQLLAQEDGAHRQRHQRIDVIAERGFDRAVGGDRPDIDAPIHSDQRGGERRKRQRARRTESYLDVGRTAERKQDSTGNRHRPQDAMRHDLDRRDMVHQLQEKRQHTP